MTKHLSFLNWEFRTLLCVLGKPLKKILVDGSEHNHQDDLTGPQQIQRVKVGLNKSTLFYVTMFMKKIQDPIMQVTDTGNGRMSSFHCKIKLKRVELQSFGRPVQDGKLSSGGSVTLILHNYSVMLQCRLTLSWTGVLGWIWEQKTEQTSDSKWQLDM